MEAAQLGAAVREQHVAVAQQGLGARLVEDGARVDLRGHLQRDPAGEVGLDEAGDDVDRRPLGGEDQVQAGGARLLGEARDRGLDVLGGDHHQVGELVDDDDDVGQLGSASPPSPSSRSRRLHRRRCVGEVLFARRLVADDAGAVAAVRRLGDGDLGVRVEVDLLLAAVGTGDHHPNLLVGLARRGGRLGRRRPRCASVDARRCSWRCRARRSWRAARSAAPSRRPPSAAPGSPSSGRSPPAAAGAGCPRRSTAPASWGRP